MKPLLFAVTAVASSSALFAISQASGFADSDHISSKELRSALMDEPEHIWVRLIKRIDLESLARDLDQSFIQLKDLNEKDSNTVLEPGTWVVLPAESAESISESSFLDGTLIRESAPLNAPPPPMGLVVNAPPAPKELVEIQSNQSLMSLVRQHGITSIKFHIGSFHDIDVCLQLERDRLAARCMLRSTPTDVVCV